MKNYIRAIANAVVAGALIAGSSSGALAFNYTYSETNNLDPSLTTGFSGSAFTLAPGSYQIGWNLGWPFTTGSFNQLSQDANGFVNLTFWDLSTNAYLLGFGTSVAYFQGGLVGESYGNAYGQFELTSKTDRYGFQYIVNGSGYTVTGFNAYALAIPAPVPEPSTWTMMLAGFAALGFAGYRSRKVARSA
jgi:hypothetical protein